MGSSPFQLTWNWDCVEEHCMPKNKVNSQQFYQTYAKDIQKNRFFSNKTSSNVFVLFRCRSIQKIYLSEYIQKHSHELVLHLKFRLVHEKVDSIHWRGNQYIYGIFWILLWPPLSFFKIWSSFCTWVQMGSNVKCRNCHI